MKTDILVGAKEFWPRLQNDLAAAKKHTYLQTLSFEGDHAGKALANALLSAKCRDKRVIADYCYNRLLINDKLLYSPRNLFDQPLRREARETVRMMEKLERGGVKMKLAGSPGFLFLKVLARNHKKLITIDDRVSYIGGINFSDHNFRWHDMMLRIEDAALASCLRHDFLATWDGKQQARPRRRCEPELHLLDGRSNEKKMRPVFHLIDTAKKSIWVESPYLTFPFLDRLVKKSQQGVAVTIITLQKNNWPLLGKYLRWETARSGIDLRFYQPGMTHLKAMLVDEKHLVIGSSNFDFFSYRIQKELVAIFRDKTTISAFKKQVVDRDMLNSKALPRTSGYWLGLPAKPLLKCLDAYLFLLSRILHRG